MAGVFQSNVFQGGGVFQTGAGAVVVPEVGGGIAPGHFSRGRWRKLQDEIEREARAKLDERLGRELKAKQAEAAERKRARQEVLARRAIEDAQVEQNRRDRLLVGAPTIAPQEPNLVPVLAARARMAMEDEEEAMALLLLHQ